MSWHFTAEKISQRITELKAATVRRRLPLAEFQIRREKGDGAGETVAAGGTYPANEETATPPTAPCWCS